jgi:hypothetical protein
MPIALPRCPRLIVLIGAVALAGTAFPVDAEWLFDAGTGVEHDDNLTRAAPASDTRADSAVTWSTSAGQHFAPTGVDGITVSGFARGAIYRRYTDLDHAEFGIVAGWRHKFGLGLLAPYLSVAASASYDDYRGKLRSSERYEAHAELGQRFSESLDGAVGIAWDARNQRHDQPSLVPGFSGSVFDLRGQSAYAHAGYAIDDRWLVAARTSVRRGLVESTAQQGLAIFVTSDAIAEDPAFHDDLLYAYRLRGTTYTGTATLSYALSDHAAIDFSGTGELTRAGQGLDYRSRIFSLSFSYRP